MAETKLTKEIKKALLYYAKADQAGVYGCYEVCLGAGYGDEGDAIISCQCDW